MRDFDESPDSHGNIVYSVGKLHFLRKAESPLKQMAKLEVKTPAPGRGEEEEEEEEDKLAFVTSFKLLL